VIRITLGGDSLAASISDAVSIFGASAKAKLSSPAAQGSPEDQLRAPLEALIKALGAQVQGEVNLIGETSLGVLRIRPDYAVSVGGALVGYIEIKAPGKGADPRRFSDPYAGAVRPAVLAAAQGLCR
jgi:hypothetical protein